MESEPNVPEELTEAQIEQLCSIFVNHLHPIIDQQQYNSAANVGNCFMEIAQKLNLWNCAGFEKALRRINSRVHLIATKDSPPNTKFRHPITKEPCDFTLWIGMGGEKEAQKHLELLNISSEQNKENLLYTGITIALDPTEILKRSDVTPTKKDPTDSSKVLKREHKFPPESLN